MTILCPIRNWLTAPEIQHTSPRSGESVGWPKSPPRRPEIMGIRPPFPGAPMQTLIVAKGGPNSTSLDPIRRRCINVVRNSVSLAAIMVRKEIPLAGRWVGRIFFRIPLEPWAPSAIAGGYPCSAKSRLRLGLIPPNSPLTRRWLVNGARYRISFAAIRAERVVPGAVVCWPRFPHGRRKSHAVQWQLMGHS